MTQDDPFARLEAGLAQPKPVKVEPPDDQQIVERAEEGFRALFDAIRKFDTILSRQSDWNARFAWLNVDSNRIAYGLLNIFKDGHVVKKMSLSFQGTGVWFEAPDFVKMAQREKENGSWNMAEISELVDALSSYIQHIVQEHC